MVRLLVVDDQPAFLRAFADMIAAVDGFELATATTAAAAAERCAEGGIQLVLMDVNLPDLDGVTAARRIEAAHPGLPVVLVSTYLAEDLPEDLPTAGRRYVEKRSLTPRLVRELWSELSEDP